MAWEPATAAAMGRPATWASGTQGEGSGANGPTWPGIRLKVVLDDAQAVGGPLRQRAGSRSWFKGLGESGPGATQSTGCRQPAPHTCTALKKFTCADPTSREKCSARFTAVPDIVGTVSLQHQIRFVRPFAITRSAVSWRDDELMPGCHPTDGGEPTSFRLPILRKDP